MNGYNNTTAMLKAILTALFIAGVAALSSPAEAEPASIPTYHLTICGEPTPTQPGSPCYVQSTTITPTPAMLDGLTQDLFNQFFSANGIIWYGNTWLYDTDKANNSGYVFGHVIDNVASADTQFVYYQGTLLCCTVDFPYRLAGMNDNGIFIGNYNMPFVSSQLTDLSVEPFSPTLDNPSGSDFLLSWMTEFTAIDNQNRISGIAPGIGTFILTPTAIPEPGTGILIISALALLLLLRQRANYLYRR